MLAKFLKCAICLEYLNLNDKEAIFFARDVDK